MSLSKTISEASLLRRIAAPINVGIVGTGYAAKKRAEALQADARANLMGATGSNYPRTREFCHNFGITPIDSWQKLVSLPELELIFICTVNGDCGAIARAGILAGKHVVVEYPLALEPQLAAEIIALAKTHDKLLHVEHMEILGGLHQSIQDNLEAIGNVFYARYATISPKHPVEQCWNYHRQMFGFPLAAALSRIHRLTNLFGTVERVNCQNRYWDVADSDYFRACLCNAQLKFTNGIIADVIYGKGDVFWHGQRTFEIHGEEGVLLFAGEKGTLIKGQEQKAIAVASRRGLFAKDTTLVLDYLLDGKPLYIQPEASLYALQVADAARQSSEIGQVVFLD